MPAPLITFKSGMQTQRFSSSRCIKVCAALLWLFLAAPNAIAANATVSALASVCTKTIKLVVGFGAGGAMDTLARAIASQLNQQGIAVYVENRLGAGGSLAAATVVQTKPDGCTWLLASPAERFINRWFVPPVRNSDVESLLPVAQLSEAPLVIAVRHDSQHQKLQDVLHTARQNTHGVNFSSSGVGSAHHLLGEMLQQKTGGTWMHVPYSGGPTAAAALMSEQVDVLIAGIAPVLPLVRSGKVRVLAVTASQRLSELPDVPTMREQGWGLSELPYWQAVFMPPNTPSSVVQAAAQSLQTAMQSPQMQMQLQAMGFKVTFQSGHTLQQWLAQETARYKHLAQALGSSCCALIPSQRSSLATQCLLHCSPMSHMSSVSLR